MRRIAIHTEFIKLEALLKLAGVTPTGGEAKLLIQEGRVSVNGEPCPLRGKKLWPGDRVEAEGETLLVTKEEEAPVFKGRLKRKS